MEEEGKEPEKPEEKVDIEGIFVAPYFREIEVYNRSRKTKVVRLLFRKGANANALLPCEVAFKVSMKSNEKLALAKLNVERDWGDMAIEVAEEDFSKDKHERKAEEANSWFKQYGPKKEKVEEKEEKERE